jgi:hypothetical protein
MTVCIAGIGGLGPSARILLCSDTRLESDFAGGEGASKLLGAGGGFFAMIAGPISSARDLLRVIRTRFDQRPDPSQDNIADELRHSATAQKQKMAEHFIRTKFAVDYKDLLTGQLELPPELYHQALFDLGQLSLGSDVIVAGFVGGVPHIYTLRQDCHVEEAEAFACIGSGEYIAHGALFQRKFRWGLDIEEAMYYVYEAKRLSEVAPGVGRSTHLRIVEPDGVLPLSQQELLALENQYQRFGLQPFRRATNSDSSQA